MELGLGRKREGGRVGKVREGAEGNREGERKRKKQWLVDSQEV